MLGHRNPQLGLFDAFVLPNCVPADSFYAQMGRLNDRLFRDQDLAAMYDPDVGRPSLPPSLMCGVLLLQFHDNVSDEEAVERLKYDLRWKIALGLPLDYAGFDPSSLSVFRKRLLDNSQERYAFDRLIQVAREADLVTDQVTLLTDTTSVKGAGAVQNTFTLLRKGIRKLLKALGYSLPSKRQGLSEQVKRLVETYLDQDKKAAIDWSDAAQREAQLNILVADAQATLELALDQSDDPQVRLLGWLLTKILGDDVVQDAQGVAHLGKGTAEDRIVSSTDPEMRHGRKSSAHRFDGFKTSVTVDRQSEFILDIADLPANVGDGQALMPMVERVETHAQVRVERAIADGAYITGDNLSDCVHHRNTQGEPCPIDLVGPLRRPQDPTTDKTAFQIDLDGQRCTCPQGHTVSGQAGQDRSGREVLKFAFERSVCEACPYFARCVHSQKNGRTVTTHPHEALLQQARARQQEEGFKELYHSRSLVERIISELVDHGLRQTRYIGAGKRRLQRLWTAAGVNLKRLLALAQARQIDLEAIISAMA